jgi:hypothetical protein
MKNKIYTIYHFISPPSNITHESVEISNKVFEKMRNLTFESQTDSITIEMTYDSFHSFVFFVVENTINVMKKESIG